MKREILSYARSFVISPEFALLVTATWIIICHPGLVNAVSMRIDTTTDYFKAALLAPFGVGYWTFQTVKEVLFPVKDKKEVLQKHPAYCDVRIVCNVALVYAILFIVLGLAAMPKMDCPFPGLPNFILIVSVLGSFIVAVTCYFAHLNINEIFCECAKDD